MPDSPPPINDLIDELKKLEAKIEASGVPQEIIANITNEIAVIKSQDSGPARFYLMADDEIVIQFSTTINSWGNRWSWVIRHMCHSPFSHAII